MSKLKLNVKNFQGLLNLPYKITYEINEHFVSLNLNVVVNDKIMFLDNQIGMYEEGQDVSVGVENALKKASEKWGIELTKAKLNVA